MVSSDLVAVFLDKVPDELRALRDTIAKEETDHSGPVWQRHRELHERVKELKDKCSQTQHSLIIALSANVGTRRRLMRNGRDERRVCIMCGTEEVGKLATVFLVRFLFRRANWKFERLNGYISRTFKDPEWYFETLSIIRNFSFSTDILLQHAFPTHVPSYSLAGTEE